MDRMAGVDGFQLEERQASEENPPARSICC